MGGRRCRGAALATVSARKAGQGARGLLAQQQGDRPARVPATPTGYVRPAEDRRNRRQGCLCQVGGDAARPQGESEKNARGRPEPRAPVPIARIGARKKRLCGERGVMVE